MADSPSQPVGLERQEQPPDVVGDSSSANSDSKLRESERLSVALQELEKSHKAERVKLSQELRELSAGRAAIKEQLWADWISSKFPDLGPAHHLVTPEDQVKLSEDVPRADRCLNVVKHHFDGERARGLDTQFGKLVAQSEEKLLVGQRGEEKQPLLNPQISRVPGSSSSNVKEKEAPEEIIPPWWLEKILKAAKERDDLKQQLLGELLPKVKVRHAELQHLLEVFDKKQLQEAYEFREKTEERRELEKRERSEKIEAEKQARFLCGVLYSKKRLESEWGKIAEKRKSQYADDREWFDNHLGNPELPHCYEEIKNLLDIENNPVFHKFLEEWKTKEVLFSSRVERKKNRVASLKNEVYQLIGFFSVFQGVVLTAVSQASLLHCNNKWSPISLSALASVVSTFAVLQKLFQINDLQTNIDSEEREFQTAVQVGQRLRREGPKEFHFVQLSHEIDQKRQLKSTKKRLLYFLLVTLTLIAFGVLFPVSHWRILCFPGPNPYQASPPTP